MPENLEGVAVVLLAIVPGFIATSAWARGRTWGGHTSELRTILQSLGWSAAIQAIVSPLTILMLFNIRAELGLHPRRLAVWFALVVLVLPAALGFGAAYALHLVRRHDISINGWHLGRLREFPSAWDWMWTTQQVDGRYVVAEFNDGRKVAGWFGASSSASTSPDRHGLFLNPEWALNEHGDLVHELPGSAGVLIPDLTQVRLLRVLEPGEEHG